MSHNHNSNWLFLKCLLEETSKHPHRMLTTAHKVGPVTLPTHHAADEESETWRDEEITTHQKWQHLLPFYSMYSHRLKRKKKKKKGDAHIFKSLFTLFRSSSFFYHAGYKITLREREDSI